MAQVSGWAPRFNKAVQGQTAALFHGVEIPTGSTWAGLGMRGQRGGDGWELHRWRSRSWLWERGSQPAPAEEQARERGSGQCDGGRLGDAEGVQDIGAAVEAVGDDLPVVVDGEGEGRIAAGKKPEAGHDPAAV